MQAFSTLLKGIRIREGKTASQCAAELGVSVAAWSQYESGKREPKIDVLRNICSALNTSPNELLGLDGAPTAINVNASGSAVVAAGPNATAIARPAPAPAACRKCPCRRIVDRLKKAGMVFPEDNETAHARFHAAQK